MLEERCNGSHSKVACCHEEGSREGKHLIMKLCDVDCDIWICDWEVVQKLGHWHEKKNSIKRLQLIVKATTNRWNGSILRLEGFKNLFCSIFQRLKREEAVVLAQVLLLEQIQDATVLKRS